MCLKCDFWFLVETFDGGLGTCDVWLECTLLHLSVFVLDSLLCIVVLALHMVDDE